MNETGPLPHEAPRAALPSSIFGFVLAVGAGVVTLWFLEKIVTALLLLFFAVVVSIALSALVRWFMTKGLTRTWAAIASLFLFFATLVLIAWLVIPRVVGQAVLLINELPNLIVGLNEQIMVLLERYPDLQAMVRMDAAAGQDIMPTALNLFRGGLGLSLSLLGGLALMIIFFSTILYIVLSPTPLLRGYLGSLPRAYRPAGMRAYRRAARAVIGWSEASVVIGAIEFVLVFVFLTLMGVPGALVWAALAFFAEFIPRIGGYIMAFPPVIVALTLGPATALWVALFYLAMNELLGSLLAPRIRGSTMRLHPVLIIFFTLAFALAFGLLGALVAVPAAAFFSAFYSEFYLKRPLKRVRA